MSNYEFRDVVDVPYDCSRDKVKTEDTRRTLRTYRGGLMEDDEFKRLIDEKRTKPMP